MKKNPVSAFIVFILFALILGGRCWKAESHPISWDVGGYYLYLPAQFIYHDPGLVNYEKFDSLRARYEVSNTFYQVTISPTGKRVIKYTLGNSVLYAPFFLVGHTIASLGHYPTDGFSVPYQQSLLWGTFIYAALALWFARKILLHFFKDTVVAFTLIAIVMGTNLYFTMSMDNLQSHYNLFFLYTLLIWSTLQFHGKPTFLRAGVMGLFAGLIILTRPTDVVGWAIPMLWGVGSLADLKNKLVGQLKYGLVFFMVAAVVFFPQMLYWKIYAGSWLYNSYNNPGEGLDLWTPHTLPFLFSYRKGWLVYTPLVWFIVFGIFLSARSKTKVWLPLLVYFIFNLWIISSWTCWWYAGSFSSRAMIQSYAVLIIPLGFFIQWIMSLKKPWSAMAKIGLSLVVLFTVFQTWQYAHGVLRSDRMTRAYYWRVFGATAYEPKNEKYLLKDKFLDTDTIPDAKKFTITREFTIDFNKQAGLKSEPKGRFIQLEGEPDYSLKLDSGQIFFTLLEASSSSMFTQYYAYLRVEGQLWNTGNSGTNPVDLVSELKYKGKTYGYAAKTLFREDTATVQGWRTFKMDYMFPDIRKPGDPFKTYFWLRGKQPAYVKKIRIYVLEAREFPELE
jgi:hypothetical protein